MSDKLPTREEYRKTKKKKLRFRKWVIAVFFVFFLSILSIGSIGIYFWLNDNKEINKMQEKVVDDTNVKEKEDNDNTEQINPPENEADDYWDYIKMNLLEVDFNDLLIKNSDTVGWIQVKGTNINYPIVQTTNNDYYLNHAFDKTENKAGWVYMDYRNNAVEFNQNTIIYAHSRYNGTMFGSLKNILNSSWYTNKENHIIRLSTPTENTMWQVFSVYTITLTDNIETKKKINIERPVTIDGNGKTITYTGTFKGEVYDNTVWGSGKDGDGQGVYVIQVYRTEATIKNITLTGGNAGLSANGATITLIGNIDVSGNGFGGIEMTKGSGVTELPYIKAGEAVITNTNETTTTPTVWTDNLTLDELESGNVEFETTEDTFAGAAFVISENQMKFYMDETKMPAESDDVVVVPITPEEPAEEPTTPPTEQEKVEDTTENPETSDGILFLGLLAIVGVAGTALTYKRLHN